MSTQLTELFDNNRRSTIGAIRAAAAGEPSIEAVLSAADDPANPYFRVGTEAAARR